MSKIFEALQKTQSGAARVALSALGEDALTSPEPAAPGKEDAISGSALSSVSSPGGNDPAVDFPTSVPAPRTESIHISPASPMLPFDGADPGAAEQYKIIRTKLCHHAAQPRMLLVSSPMPGDGKTISAANLAGALALQEGVRVVLVDCDFRRSSLTRILGLSPVPGLAEIIAGSSTLETALVSVKQLPNLYFLPPGAPTPNPSELLSTAKWQELLEIFRREFRFAVFDAPPVGMVADYELLQRASDGVVLVARPDHTNRQLWRKALETVPKSKQLGVILNCVEKWFLWKTQGYYYYSDREQ